MPGVPIDQRKQDKVRLKAKLGIPLNTIARQEQLDWRTVRKYSDPQDSRFETDNPVVKRALQILLEDDIYGDSCWLRKHAIKRDKLTYYQVNMMRAINLDKWFLLTGESNKPLVALQIVGLSQDQMQALIAKPISSSDPVASPIPSVEGK